VPAAAIVRPGVCTAVAQAVEHDLRDDLRDATQGVLGRPEDPASPRGAPVALPSRVAFLGREHASRGFDAPVGGGAGGASPGKLSRVARVYRDAAAPAGPVAGPQQAAAVQAASGGGGVPLPSELRAMLERALGVSLDGVRLHDDAASHAAARAIGARAYAVGQDIHFAQGAFAPDGAEGRRLIAHEVAHTVQQKGTPAGALPNPAAGEPFRLQAGSPSGTVQGKLEVSQPGDAAEVEADHFADAFVAGRPAAPISASAGAGLHRDPAPANQTPAGGACQGPPAPAPAPVVPPPPANGATIDFGGRALSKDPRFVRFQLEQVTAQGGGLKGLRAFVASFRAQVARDRDVQRAPGSPATMTPPPAVPIHAGGASTQLIGEIEPVVVEQAAALEKEVADFLTFFGTVGIDSILQVLFDSEKRVHAEADRYGVGATPADPEASKKDRAEMAKQAKAVHARWKAVVAAKKKVEESRKPELNRGNPMYARALYEEAPKMLNTAQQELTLARISAEGRFPIIASYTSRERWDELEGLGNATPTDQLGKIREEIQDKLDNIAKVREKASKHEIDIFKLPQTIKLAKSKTATLPGSMHSAVVDERVVAGDDDNTKLILGCILIGLALLTAIPTGGASLAVTATVVGAEAASVAISAYLLYQGFEEYQLEKAETGNEFDKAQAVSQSDPSLLSLALEIVGVIPTVKGAVSVFKGLAQMRKLALVRQATRGGKAATEALEELAKEGNKVKGGLGDRLRQEVVGAAQNPRLVWAPNPDGPRTLEQALAVARGRGIDIPADIRFGVVTGKWPKGRFAEYAQLGQRQQGDVITWEELYNRFNQIPVRLNPEVLASDEAIVAVIGHEMHELNALRRLFAESGGSMSVRQFRRLVIEGVPGNLHDQAWDVSDNLVGAMRGGGGG
jgi:hypothetical protein